MALNDTGPHRRNEGHLLTLLLADLVELCAEVGILGQPRQYIGEADGGGEGAGVGGESPSSLERKG